jgi:hypothetical protein
MPLLLQVNLMLPPCGAACTASPRGAGWPPPRPERPLRMSGAHSHPRFHFQITFPIPLWHSPCVANSAWVCCHASLDVRHAWRREGCGISAVRLVGNRSRARPAVPQIRNGSGRLQSPRSARARLGVLPLRIAVHAAPPRHRDRVFWRAGYTRSHFQILLAELRSPKSENWCAFKRL